MFLSKTSSDRIAPSNEKVGFCCRKCGGTDLLFGKKYAVCKECRIKTDRPAKGYTDKDGNPKVFKIWKCQECDKMFCTGDDEVHPCPSCNNTLVEKIEEW